VRASSLIAGNGDVRIAYDVRGSGHSVLLIHGLGYGRWGWQPVADPLAEDLRVLTYDNRGLGESDVPPGPYTVRQLAADAVAVLDAAEVERAYVVGTSLGGMVAQELAISFPERVERLVLACTTPGGPASYPMPQQTVDLMLEAPQLPPDVALRRFVENALAPEADHGLVERILELRLANPLDPAGWHAQAAAGAAFDALDRLGRVEARTLVVTGTEDAVVDWRNSQLLAERITDARLELFPGTGHLFFWEEPKRFVELVKEFLS
jgi:pimeloyl-ACP methyl ester carboxylesterase